MKTVKINLLLMLCGCIILFTHAASGETDITEVTVIQELSNTITPSADPNGTIQPAEPVIVNCGDSQQFTAYPNIGYEADTWYLDGDEAQAGETTFTLSNIQADHTVHVTFKKLSYTITASAGLKGSIDPDGPITVNYGDNQKFTAKPDSDYEVKAWYLDGNKVQTGRKTYTLSNIQADHMIYVSFKRITYDIIAIPGRNGSVSPRSITVHPGDDVQFTASPDNGYIVDTWFLYSNDVQIGGPTYTLGNINSDYTVRVTFRKILSQSLGSINFEDDKEFAKIGNNNFNDPDNPENNRTHIKRDADLGVMLMQNALDLDPDSPDFGQMVQARAKGSFIGTGADKILIQFMYLFNTSDPGVELVVYLSDRPWLYDPDDPRRAMHSLEVARVPNPPFPRPGSAGSERFAIFEKVVGTGHLNITDGLWIELELFEPPAEELLFTSSTAGKITNSGDTSVMIDSWSPAVQCYGICLDINWDNFVNESDFLVVVGECGHTTTGDLACLEGVFSTDGTVDTLDVVSWDWALNSEDRLLNFCGVPLTSEDADTVGAALGSLEGSGQPQPLADLPENISDLLIAGKRGESNAASKLKDRLYAFDNSGLCGGLFESEPDRGNIGLVQGPNGELYQINSETGLLRLDNNNEVIVPPGEVELTDINEPRYDGPATVYIGIQDEGPDSFGRPILDAVFDTDYVYVVPVVVYPESSEPYTAAARLRLLDQANPPYEVVELYDDPPLPNDNQYRDYLREIELDGAGNLYVLNVHSYNESDILWRYYPDGAVERIDLGRPDSNNYIPAPVGMYASKTADMLYLASAADNPQDCNSTVIYGFSTKDALILERTVTINGMHHVTGITENPQTGSVWVAGFNMYDVPQYPNPTQPAFYYPHLAKIPYGGNDAQLISLFDPAAHDLALPMSVIWTSTAKCGGADLDESGEVSFGDFAILAEHWLDTNCASPEWCDSADVDKSYTVDMTDLAILTENWLESGCLD